MVFSRQQGISYIEIMLVVTILSVTAAVTVPNFSANDGRKLDVAVADIAEAIRFTRIEAMRNGISHGIIVDAGNETVKVYSLPAATPVYDVFHPVDKKLYTLNFTTDAAAAGVDLQSYSFYYGSTGGSQAVIEFNRFGNPKYSSAGTDYMLNGPATITLAYSGQTRIISVAPMTGRVTMQ